MRIIAGRFKGVRLAVVPGRRLRPSTGRVREALFSALGSAVVDAWVLELFAGSGAFGFEALSRGARRAFFVDNDRGAAAAIKRVAESLRVADAARVLVTDADAAVRKLQREGAAFDLIFLDPPYGTDDVARIAAEPAICQVIRPEGCLIVERSAAAEPVGFPACFVRRFSRSYGGTVLEMFDHLPHEANDI